MPDLTKLLQEAQPREITVLVCLAGDATGEVQALEAELEGFGEWAPSSLGDSDPRHEVRERLAEARARARESSVPFRFRALGHRAYSTLLAAHPAPEGSQEPYDAGTFLPALLAACCVEPSLTAAQVDRLLDVVNDGQARQLFGAAVAVNEEPSPVPFL